MRILIVQMAKLGDFIQSLPLIEAAAAQWPSAEVVLLAAQKAVAEAAGHIPAISRAVVIEPQDFASIKPEQLLGTDFEAIFVLNSDRRVIEFCGGLEARQRFGPQLGPGGVELTGGQKLAAALMRLNRRLGSFNLVDLWRHLLPGAPVIVPRWPLDKAGEEEAASLLPGVQNGGLLVAVQLGGQNHLRRWPVEYFADALVRLSETQTVVPVILGTAPEKVLGLKLELLLAEKKYKGPVFNLMGRTSLGGLAGVLHRADLLITGDTGVMHMAAASQTPVAALFFGPAFGPETGPYGSGHYIYQALAPCGPCLEQGPCRRRQCAELPSPNLLAGLARQILTGGRAGALGEALMGHEFWQTRLDSFGQSLWPLSSKPLNYEAKAALSIREAGRQWLRPDYVPGLDPDEKKLWLAAEPTTAERNDLNALLADLTVIFSGDKGAAVQFSQAAHHCFESISKT